MHQLAQIYAAGLFFLFTRFITLRYTPLTKALDVAFAADAFIPRRRVYRPDGSEGEATRKFCVSLRSPLDLQSKNKGREIIPTFVRVNQRREVN